MNDKVKKCLRERSKLIKFYYEHGQKNKDQGKLQAKAACCTERYWKLKTITYYEWPANLTTLKQLARHIG